MVTTANKKKQKKKSDTVEDEKIDSLLNKGIELVETGLDLGINIMSKLSGLAQQKVDEWAGGHSPQTDNADNVSDEYQTGMEKPVSAVSNRVVLVPGSPVKVSFSIENESPSATKELAFKVGDVFIGEASGHHIRGKGFSVKPSKKSIDPMDFEKLVLSGKIPKNAPPDIYRGLIIVSGEEQYQISVSLKVNQPSS